MCESRGGNPIGKALGDKIVEIKKMGDVLIRCQYI